MFPPEFQILVSNFVRRRIFKYERQIKIYKYIEVSFFHPFFLF